MNEMLAGLIVMSETQLQNKDITPEQSKVLSKVLEELKCMSKIEWTLDNAEEFQDRLGVTEKKLIQVKDK